MSDSKDWNLLRRCIQKWVLFFNTLNPLNQPFWCGSSSYCAKCFFLSARLAIRYYNRRHHCLQTLFFLFKFVTSETKESFVTRTNASLVGALISVGDVSVVIHVVPYFKTVNWILALGRVRERYIRKGNKNRNKIERLTWFIFTQYFGSSTGTSTEKKTSTKYKMKSLLFLFSFFTFFCGLTLPSVGFSWLFLWFSTGDFNDPGLLKIRLISLVWCCFLPL